MYKTLALIADKLNHAKVTWAVGASMLLEHYGLADKPHDIDLLVALEDIHIVDEILSALGQKKVWEKAETYSTKHFLEYSINGVELDVLAGFTVNHEGGAFEYIFDNASIAEVVQINGVAIPFSSLEDWYVIYQMIPGRDRKVGILEEYLNINGVKRRDLLERNLLLNIPPRVRERIQVMLEEG